MMVVELLLIVGGVGATLGGVIMYLGKRHTRQYALAFAMFGIGTSMKGVGEYTEVQGVPNVWSIIGRAIVLLALGYILWLIKQNRARLDQHGDNHAV